MTRDAIFQALSPDSLVEAARYISFNPNVSQTSYQSFSALKPDAQAKWLDEHRLEFEDEVCRVGSWTFGSVKPYQEIVRALALDMSVTHPAKADVSAVELAIVTKVWNDAVTKLTPAQIEELKIRATELAAKYGKALGKEMTGFVALSAAQLSGFGVYILGSTLLGALNGALGLGLTFGAFTGLSSLISTVIGPVGWAALGLATFIKLGAPNYKKLLPIIILIATQRQAIPDEEMMAAKRKVMNQNLTLEQQDAIQNIVTTIINSGKYGPTSPGQIKRTSSVAAKGVLPKREVPEHKSPITNELEGFPGDLCTQVENGDRGGIAQEEIRRVQTIVESSSQPAKVNRVPEPKPIRKLSGQERTIFDLRNRELIRVASQLEVDYHSASPEVQCTIQLLLREQQASEKATVEMQIPFPSQTNARPRNGKSADRHSQIERKRKEFKFSHHTLEFRDEALEWYCILSHEDAMPFLSELSQMERGFLEAKHHVPLTKPKVFQRDAGRSGRIYYRRQDGAAAVLILRIGDKSTQSADYSSLRLQTC